MSNLTPELRTDKNGKTMIRHVRPQKAGKSGTPALPPPTPVVDQAESLVDDASNKLAQLGFPDMGGKTLRANLKSLANSNVDLFHEVVNHVLQAGESERAVWYQILDNRQLYEPESALKNYRERGVTPRSFEHVYRKAMGCYPLATRLRPMASGQNGSMYTTDMQRMVEEGASMTPKDMDSKDVSVIKAVMIQTRIEVLKQGGNRGQGISLKGLTANIAYLAENMGAVEPLVDELMRVRSTDREMVEGLLAVRTPALREGVL